jgi:hypothetical protein
MKTPSIFLVLFFVSLIVGSVSAKTVIYPSKSVTTAPLTITGHANLIDVKQITTLPLIFTGHAKLIEVRQITTAPISFTGNVVMAE